MSEDSEKEDYSDRTISDEDESDEDTFMKFVSADIHPCTFFTADSISDPYFPRTTQILLEYQLGRWVPRLREPRDLYGVSSSGPLSPTRWPYHCEVINEKVRHIGREYSKTRKKKLLESIESKRHSCTISPVSLFTHRWTCLLHKVPVAM
ncbi:cytosolic carboxypeptidase 3 isoform X4 [Erinaceus europaeus]|uniref:Cytosolic carboxypeptidase 3 isoform X4 n=1 Tax=Erinaceus europaeus TaxID=9365 RepID=A0ABM3XUV3_ERIEU|nr:cytosolic carboxypeptidase 3 isoform X4 [Erinaceus europaeus]